MLAKSVRSTCFCPVRENLEFKDTRAKTNKTKPTPNPNSIPYPDPIPNPKPNLIPNPNPSPYPTTLRTQKHLKTKDTDQNR